MKKMLLALMLTSTTFLFTNDAQAAGYGPAGCGIGTMILGDDATGVKGGLAMYINAAFWGPTSVTLGVLNCGGGGVASLDQEAQEYISTNQTQLIEDSIKSESESIVALADLMSCDDTSSFISNLKSTNAFEGEIDSVYQNVANACK